MNWKVQNHLEHLPPAQRKWVGLTYEELHEIYQTTGTVHYKFALVEAKLKEKND
jgi:hypothetical protein